MALISIIIPCYNDGQYLEEALRSVIRQTFTDYEIIVVNDGSKDPLTLKVLDNVQEKYKLKVIHQENKGLPAARNTGIREAKGSLILPLDADDTFEPDFIERTLRILESDPEIKAVSSYARKFGTQNGIIEMTGGTLKDFIYNCSAFPASLYRKSDWEEIGGYDELMVKSYEEWEFYQRLLAMGGRVHLIPEPLFNYRVKEESLAVTGGINRYANMEYMVTKNLELYKQFPLEAVLCSERMVKDTKAKYEKMLQSVYHSASYRLGYTLLQPLRFFKRRRK